MESKQRTEITTCKCEVCGKRFEVIKEHNKDWILPACPIHADEFYRLQCIKEYNKFY